MEWRSRSQEPRWPVRVRRRSRALPPPGIARDQEDSEDQQSTDESEADGDGGDRHVCREAEPLYKSLLDRALEECDGAATESGDSPDHQPRPKLPPGVARHRAGLRGRKGHNENHRQQRDSGHRDGRSRKGETHGTFVNSALDRPLGMRHSVMDGTHAPSLAPNAHCLALQRAEASSGVSVPIALAAPLAPAGLFNVVYNHGGDELVVGLVQH